MRLFVCIKQVPDTETRILLTQDRQNIDSSGIKWVINPYDEFAIEEAIRFRDTHPEARITAITLGPKGRVNNALLTAMAMGVDDSILINSELPLDALATAKALAAAIKQEGKFSIVYAGRLAIDDNVSAVPLMTAQFLNVPHASMVSAITYNDRDLTARREVEGGSFETFKLSLPALVTTNKGLNKPRFASLPGIMKAKKKPIKNLTPDDLGIGPKDCKVRFTNYEMPPDPPPCKIIKGEPKTQVNELVRFLQEEAKVL